MKKIVMPIIIMLCLVIFIICSYVLLKDLLQYKEINNNTSKLIEDNVIKVENDKKEESVAIDWEKLKNINEDIIGWIKIKDTKINYPILKDQDLYYMNHTYEKKYNRNGSIFTKIDKSFMNDETIIYGHNMRNGIMFADIEKFMSEDFFYSHPSFEIYTQNANYRANIFSIYSIGVNEETDNIRKLNLDEKIQYYKSKSKFKVENIEENQNILKLCTCSYLNNKTRPTNQRYFLTSYLEKIE